MLLKGIIVYVGEVHIIELHPAELFQLFLHTAAHLQRKNQELFDLLLIKHSIWIQQLHIGIHHLADSDRVTLVQILAYDIYCLFLLMPNQRKNKA